MTQAKHTPGPWFAHNMVHEGGRPMTPKEIGEYVCNSVKMGAADRFLFISGKHDDGGDADICHVGNGPRGPYNARLISAAPDLLAKLVEIREWMDPEMSGWDAKFCKEVDALIAKAKGTE
jgi:hypothetical protein